MTLVTATVFTPGTPTWRPDHWPLQRITSMQPYVYGSDESCLVAALHGSEHAWSALESQLSRPIRRVAERWSRGLSPDLRAEIVQDSWSAAVRHAPADFDPGAQTALQFVAGFVPNAAQRVRAAYRPPGARSRAKRVRRAAERHHVPQDGWNPPAASVLEEIEATTPDESWEARMSSIDARLDIERALHVATPEVARAILLILEDGASFAEAAQAVGLSTSTFKRRLAALADDLHQRQAA